MKWIKMREHPNLYADGVRLAIALYRKRARKPFDIFIIPENETHHAASAAARAELVRVDPEGRSEYLASL